MKKSLRIIAGALPLAIFCLLLFCTDFKNNNPATSSYQGDYSLQLSWALPLDTMEVFKQYKIICVQGRDTFSSYKVDSPLSPMTIDTLIRISGAIDTVGVHFTRPIKDTMTFAVSGVRPNKETVIDTIKAHVINPYRISSNAGAVIMGKSIIVSVSRPDNKPVVPGFSAVWSVNGSVKSTQTALKPYIYFPPVQQTQAITARLQDTVQNGFYLDTVYVSVGGYQQNLLNAALKTNAKLGDPLTLSLAQTDVDSSKFRIFVVSASGWRDSSAFMDFTQNATIQLGRPVIDTNPQTDTIYTIDINGLISNILLLPMTVTYSLPVVNFSADSLIVSLNDTTPVTLGPQSTGAKFIWVLDSIDTLKPDPVNSATCIILLHDTLQHILKVTGVDNYGYAGNAAFIRVRAHSFGYVVQPVAFPTQPKVNTLTTWIAAVKDTALARQKNAIFHWAIFPPNFDSIAITGKDSSILQLRWSDIAVTTITLTVTDNINEGCAPYSKNVSVRRFAPSVKFLNTKPLFGKTTEAINLIVTAADSNSDGTIQKILWQRTGKFSIKDSTTDTTWQFMPVSPDTFDVYAWARDNDGFLSQPDTIHVMVKAYRPFIQPVMRDTAVFINSPVRFVVSGNISDPSATMAKYLWDFDGNGTWDDSSTSDTITHTFVNSGKTTVIVKCRDNNKLESAPDTFFVTVSTGAPVLQKIKPDSVWIDDDTLYTITAQANPTTTLKQRVVQWEAGGKWDTSATDTMRHIYTSAGLKQVTCFVIDNNGTISNIVNKTVLVLLGAPSVASVTIDSALSKIFINDTLHFTVHGFDPNGQIDSIKVAWTGPDSAFTQTLPASGNAATFAKAFSSSGPQTIRFRVIDNDGLTVDTTIIINVLLGKPFVSSVIVDTSAAKNFINKPVKIAVHGHDNNGHIDSVKIAWNGDSMAFSPRVLATNDTAAFVDTFTSSGPKQIRVRVYDDDGLSADTTISFYVHLGKPVVTSIAPDSVIFINDARKFLIATYDSNGTIDSVKIDNGSGIFGLFIKTFNGYDTLKRVFARLEAGSKTIRVIAKDNDGLLSDTAKQTFTVRLAAPVIDSMQVPATIWINDTNTYQIVAHDTNGTIVKYYFDWTNSGAWQDSSTTGSAQGHFNAAGADSIRFGVMDNDTLLTISKKKIMVHLGVPHIWNPSGDTMFVVTPAGGGNDTLRISHYDTNGTIQTFYWAMSSISGLDTSHVYAKGSADSLIYNIPQTSVNLSFQMAVFGKDDDGNVSGDTFWLFPDAPPPAPTINAVAGTDSVMIYWLGKDVKDGNMTQYRVLLHNNGEPDSTITADILSNWKSGYRVSDLPQFDFMLKVKVAHSVNLYYYQVQARDARGSVTLSTTGHTFSY
jgi:PKD repeat protein